MNNIEQLVREKEAQIALLQKEVEALRLVAGMLAQRSEVAEPLLAMAAAAAAVRELPTYATAAPARQPALTSSFNTNGGAKRFP